MKYWLCILLLATLPQGLMAAPVKVTSGEHEGFTRLVMEYAGPVDWTVGRALDGYGLRLGGDNPGYDLSGVFDIIGKSRLAAIWLDPGTQILRIGIACACHVIPFEFRPGIVVLDLKDGPPPQGSSFELALGDERVEQIVARSNPRPRARPKVLPVARVSAQPALSEPALPRPGQGAAGRSTVGQYDWIAALPPEKMRPMRKAAATAAAVTTDPMLVDLTLQPLRDQLLRQMSRGAAEGVIEMAMPVAVVNPAKGMPFASAQVRLGEMPGVSTGTGLPGHGDLAANGRTCTPAEALDFMAWGDSRPIFDQMAGAMAGLTGEFDRPDQDAVQKAVRFNLYLGFGAEADQLLQAFPQESPEAAIWKSLAHLLDDTPDPSPVFADQADCDTPAALWAILSETPPVKGERQDARAALLAFSALPLHLRRHLGARLADRFMAVGEAESARAIRDAILRAPGVAGAEVYLMQARMDLRAGDPQAAEARAEEVLTDAGPNAGEALIALTEARVAQMLPVEPSVVAALEAMIPEHEGTPDVLRYQRALVLAQAASGDFDAAFAQGDTPAGTTKLVWAMLGKIGEDAALLNHAVLDDTAVAPALEAEVAGLIGARLAGLGFPDQALKWLSPAADFDPLLVAKAQLQQRDARAALLTLDGQTSPEALTLRAAALQSLGEAATAAEVYVTAGDPEAAWRATGLAHDWPKLADSGPDPWKRAAASAVGAGAAGAAGAATTPSATTPPEGPLARSRRLADDSAATREALDILLAAVPDPANESQ